MNLKTQFQFKTVFYCALLSATCLTAVCQDSVARVGQAGVTPPKFIKRVAPEYPMAAIKDHLEGYVILEVILRKDGSVDDIEVLRGLAKGAYGFEESAIQAVKQWQFTPGQVDGEPADVRMTLKIDFVLDGKFEPVAIEHWRVSQAGTKWDAKPKAKRAKGHSPAIGETSFANLFVTINLDDRGEVIDFEFDNKTLENFSIPEHIYQKLEAAIQQFEFEPAKQDGQGVPTTLSINIPIIL